MRILNFHLHLPGSLKSLPHSCQTPTNATLMWLEAECSGPWGSWGLLGRGARHRVGASERPGTHKDTHSGGAAQTYQRETSECGVYKYQRYFFAIYLEPVVFGSQWRPSSYWWVCEANIGTDKHPCVGWFLSKGEFEALRLSHTLQILDSFSHKTTWVFILACPLPQKANNPPPSKWKTHKKQNLK